MTRNDFRQKALIHIASALVKVMDEQCGGVLDNEAAHTKLAVNAVSIINALEDVAASNAALNIHGIYFDDDVIPEEELTDDEKRIKRMAEEYDELCGRFGRLRKFLDTDKFKSLPEHYQALLKRQARAMDDYESTLRERIQIECANTKTQA